MRRSLRQRGEVAERTFTHLCETVGHRRATVRGMSKVTAWYQLQSAAHNPQPDPANTAGHRPAARLFGRVADRLDVTRSSKRSPKLSGSCDRLESSFTPTSKPSTRDSPPNSRLIHSRPKTSLLQRAAKLEGKQGEIREVLLFPEVRKALEELMVEPDGAESVVRNQRQGANSNLKMTLEKIIVKAKVEPWKKPFQNLRSSRETQLAEQYPVHVVVK